MVQIVEYQHPDEFRKLRPNNIEQELSSVHYDEMIRLIKAQMLGLSCRIHGDRSTLRIVHLGSNKAGIAVSPCCSAFHKQILEQTEACKATADAMKVRK